MRYPRSTTKSHEYFRLCNQNGGGVPEVIRKTGVDYYCSRIKKSFTILARAEQEHHDALVEMKSSIGSKIYHFTALKEVECVFQPLLAKRDLISELKENPDAYQFVVKEEEKGIRSYEDLAAQVKDESVRKILLMIVAEERKHLSVVENVYSFHRITKNPSHEGVQ